MKAQVYLVRNLKNNKTYIGQTRLGTKKRLQDHWRDAKRGSTTYFHRAMRKYGRENFIIEILEEGPAETIHQCEIHFIASLKPNYNLTKGGLAGKGFPKIVVGTMMWVTDGLTQKRIKISEGVPEGCWRGVSYAAKKANSESLVGRKFTDEHKSNISKAKRVELETILPV